MHARVKSRMRFCACAKSRDLFKMPSCTRSRRRRFAVLYFTSWAYNRIYGNICIAHAQKHPWWLKRRGLAYGCAFWVFVDIASHNGCEIPPKPHFVGVNKRFQAKQAKYWKFHVIETTASILTKFCRTIETRTTKWTSWVIPIASQQIEDGGRPPFKKRLNRHISAIVRPIWIKFDTLTHIGPLHLTDRWSLLQQCKHYRAALWYHCRVVFSFSFLWPKFSHTWR